jgi:protein-S-isoprenylcysteine O-methyltransferase Ste14
MMGMTQPISAPVSSVSPALWQLPRRGSKVYDLLAAAPLIVWFAIVLRGSLQGLGALVGNLLLHPNISLCLLLLAKLGLLVFASTAICMLLRRRPAQSGASGLLPRVAGILGTYLSVGILLFPPAHLSPLWLGISAFLIFGGVAFSCYSILWLGRSFSLMAEARQLVTGGPYSIIRHPLYFGEEIAIIGTAIQFFSPLVFWVLAMQIACQFYRMHCEEEILASSFPEYRTYKSRTARLIPGLY